MNLQRDADQVKIRNKSILVTLLCSATIFGLLFISIVIDVPEVVNEEILPEEYKILCSIDYGNRKNGSLKINKIAPATIHPDPIKAIVTPTSVTPRKTITPVPRPVAMIKPVVNILSTPVPQINELIVPPVQEIKKSGAEIPFIDGTESTNKVSKAAGGSNHGDGTGIGNRGTPNTKVLDPEGLYSFGSGNKGLLGRRPLLLIKPEYTVQKEDIIRFELTIRPDGSVQSVYPLTLSDAPELIKSGRMAIMKWKFNSVDSEEFQKTQVTITFRLK